MKSGAPTISSAVKATKATGVERILDAQQAEQTGRYRNDTQ